MTPDDYQQAIHQLARTATMPDAAAARLQAALGRAFESSTPRSEGHGPRRIRFAVLAAAAALVLAAAGGAWYAWRQPATSNNVTGTSSSVAAQAGPKASTTGGKVHPKRDTTDVHRQAGRRFNKIPPVVDAAGFVTVPAAAGLPQFESGLIVRVSLPVAALPSYGVDISPASSDRPVEADVLVGQDGQTRAIRLVNTSRSQQ